MKLRILIAALALAGCASNAAAPAPTPQNETPATPPQKSAQEKALEPFELPPALATNPDTLKISALPFQPPAPTYQKLPNGLEVYMLEDHTVPLVNVRALIRLGGVDEPANQVGISDLTVACMHQCGAGNLTSEQLEDTLEYIAAAIGGGATDELSDLSLNARTSDTDKALGIFADVLRRPRFEDARLKQLLARSAEAVRRREDNPGATADRAFQKAVFGKDHPIARETTLETLKNITRKDVQAFYERTVTPSAVKLIVTGDLPSAEMLKRVEAAFGDWKGGPGVQRNIPKPEPKKREVILVPRPIAQAKVRIGHLGFVRHDPREYAFRLLDAVLGSSTGPTRLYTEIRDRRGLAYNVGSVIAPGTVGGLFEVAADTKPESTGEVIEQSLKILEGLNGAQPVAPNELSRAKDVFVNTFAFRFDTPEKAAFEKALHDFYGYPQNYFATFRDNIAGVTPDSMTAAAKALIHLDELQIVVVGDPAKVGDLSKFGTVRTVKNVAEMK